MQPEVTLKKKPECISMDLNLYFTAKELWNRDITTGEYYQLNLHSALTWHQAEASCKQQSASLLSITDPHQKAFISGKGIVTPYSIYLLEKS